jgi:hypothetical protein
MDAASLTNRTITGIFTPLCSAVHPAWVDKHTTPIATSSAVLQLDSGDLLMVGPCEVDVPGEKYPALGLSVEGCDSSALQWVRGGRTYEMRPLEAAALLLPLLVARVDASDPLDEGPVSEISLVRGDGSRVLFRHIMPPMTLGIDVIGAMAGT